MYPLLESLKLNDGIVQQLEYHQERINRSMKELFPEAKKLNLSTEISIPENCSSGIYKVRVLYGADSAKIEIAPYMFRTIKSLKVVHHESIDYHLKYSDRHILDELFAQRAGCDDVIIIKNGFVTDSFAANLLFFEREKWFTPTTPLLKGTKRQFLLDEGIIVEREIRESELHNFQKVGLVNAMIDFEEMPIINFDRIEY